MQTWILLLLISLLAVAIFATTRSRTVTIVEGPSTSRETRVTRTEPLPVLRLPLSGSKKALVATGMHASMDLVLPLVQILQTRNFQVQALPNLQPTQLQTACRIFLASLQPGDMGLLWICAEATPNLGEHLAALKTGVRLVIGADIHNVSTTLGLAYPFLGAEDSFQIVGPDDMCTDLESATVQVREAADVSKVVGIETNADVLVISGKSSRYMTRAVQEILRRYSFTFNVTLSGLQGAATSLLRNANCRGAVQLSLGRELSPTSSISAWGL